MKIQILIDNIAGELANPNGCVHLCPEWGFAAHIEFNGKNILLDTGASKKFVKNAAAMNVDLSKVDCGILSHAHYDHSDGMSAFFELNSSASFYLRRAAAENCYHKVKLLKLFTVNAYIGIHKGFLKRFADRIKYLEGDSEILPGVFLVPHKTQGLSEIGRRAKFSVKENGKYRDDSFDHEQSLVFETPKGLFIMNSCSHGGADNIVKEIEATFPGKPIYAILGGFHLYRTPDDQVKAFAERLKALNVQKIYTGHCTGDHAFEILKKVLGNRAEQMRTGMQIEL